MKSLIQKIDQLNGWSSNNALIKAAGKGHFDIVKMLIKCGANVNYVEHFNTHKNGLMYKKSALIEAAENGIQINLNYDEMNKFFVYLSLSRSL